MAQTSSTTLEYEPKKPLSLGQQTSRGMVWMVGQTLLTKVLGIVGQIVLAWYVLPGAWGQVGLAYAVASFPSLIRDAGLQQILVHRHTSFKLWVAPVFWISLVLGVISGLVLVVAGPIAEHFYRSPGLARLIYLMAMSSVATAVATVPAAFVQAELRFRFQAILATATAVFNTLLNIIFAQQKFGADSFVLALLLTNMARTVALWVYCGLPVPMRLQTRRWKYIFSDSWVLLATSALGMLISQGDYLILGRFTNDRTVGLFFFAFNLSLQAIGMLSGSLSNVLFPALRKLGDQPSRQVEAFIKSARIFASITIPFCLLQAVLSDPGVRLLFKPTWYPSIPILQILCIAMTIKVASMPGGSLAAAQNRLKFTLLWTLGGAIIFLAMVAVAAKFGGANAGVAVAVAELIFFFVSDTNYVRLLLKLNKQPFRKALHIYDVPLAAGFVAAFAAWGVTLLIPHESRVLNFLSLGAGTLVMALVYAVLIRLWAPDLWLEIRQRIGSII